MRIQHLGAPYSRENLPEADQKGFQFTPYSRDLRRGFLDCDAFYASNAQRDRPDLRDRPVAIVLEKWRNATIVARSYEARSFGVKTEMGLEEALRLCPSLAIVEADPKTYRRVHRELFQLLSKYCTGLESFSIDEMAFDLPSGFSPQNAAQFSEALKSSVLINFGPQISFGIGFAPNRCLAKIGAEMRKPNGEVILAGNYEETLKLLPIDAVPNIGQARTAKLRDAGIATMEQLLQAPRNRLQSILKPAIGRWLYETLRGDLDFDYSSGWSSRRRSFSCSVVLYPDHSSYTDTQRAVMALIRRGVNRMRLAGRVASHLAVHLEYRSATNFKRSRVAKAEIYSPIPVNDFINWMSAIDDRFALEKIPKPPGYIPFRASIKFDTTEDEQRPIPSLFKGGLGTGLPNYEQRAQVQDLVEELRTQNVKIGFGSFWDDLKLPDRIPFGPPREEE